MLPLIIISVVGIILYAAYHVFGPFFYNEKWFWHTIINVVTAVLWVALSVMLALQIVPEQSTVFRNIVYVAGGTIGVMSAMILALFICWLFLQWIYLTVIPEIISKCANLKNR